MKKRLSASVSRQGVWWWERIVFLRDPILFYLSWQLHAQHSPPRVQPRLSPLRPGINREKKGKTSGGKKEMKTSLSIMMITGNNCAEFVKQLAHFWATSIREEMGFMLLWWKELMHFLQLPCTQPSNSFCWTHPVRNVWFKIKTRCLFPQ